jgi:hypothetical protein
MFALAAPWLAIKHDTRGTLPLAGSATSGIHRRWHHMFGVVKGEAHDGVRTLRWKSLTRMRAGESLHR